MGTGRVGSDMRSPETESTHRGLRRVVHAWREPFFLAVLYGLYELARAAVPSHIGTATEHGYAILRWERSWHIAVERSLNQATDQVTAVAVAESYAYATLHYVVTPLVLIWLHRYHRPHYVFARNVLVWSTLVGLICFLTVPTAPPRLLAHSGVSDTLAAVQHYGWWGGQASAPKGLGGLSDQLAAMPSLHVGWALWCGVLLHQHGRRDTVRALGVAYPVVMSVVVMGTGNHWFADVLAGAGTMAVGLLLAELVERVRRRRRPVAPPAG